MTIELQQRVVEFAEQCYLTGAMDMKLGQFHEDSIKASCKEVLELLQDEWSIDTNNLMKPVEVTTDVVEGGVTVSYPEHKGFTETFNK